MIEYKTFLFEEKDFIDNNKAVTLDSVLMQISYDNLDNIFLEFLKSYCDISKNIVPLTVIDKFTTVELSPTVADIFENLICKYKEDTPTVLLNLLHKNFKSTEFEMKVLKNENYINEISPVNLYRKLLRAYFFDYTVERKSYFIKILISNKFHYYTINNELIPEDELLSKEEIQTNRIDFIKESFQENFYNIDFFDSFLCLAN